MKNEQAFTKLLKVARARADETARRIAELESAQGETEKSLRILADCVHTEEAAARAAEAIGFTLLSGYFVGAGEKRAALLQTKSGIAAEIEAARAALEAAFAETMRLEHLIERARLSTREKKRRLETVATEAAALSRYRRAARS